MGYKTRRDNFRVEVKPDNAGQSEDRALHDCDLITHSIRRHVDGLDTLDGGLGVRTAWDIIMECEFCGYPWGTGKDSAYNDGCCEEDEKIRLEMEGPL